MEIQFLFSAMNYYGKICFFLIYLESLASEGRDSLFDNNCVKRRGCEGRF